ncbi:MAG: hypothetical protein ACTSVW_04625 [Candidatus Njordarchaeales archaeon]
MPLPQIERLINNITQTGNNLGIDKRSILYFIGDTIWQDPKGENLILPSQWNILGPFISVFLHHILEDSAKNIKLTNGYIAEKMKEFQENFKPFEPEIKSSYLDHISEINQIATTFRKYIGQAKVYVGEVFDGSDLYLSGYIREFKTYLGRFLNSLEFWEAKNVYVLSPITFFLVKKFVHKLFPESPFKFYYYPLKIMEKIRELGKNSLPNKLKVIFFEPQMDKFYFEEIDDVLRILNVTENLEITKIKKMIPPINFINFWLINPKIAVNYGLELIQEAQDRDIKTIVTLSQELSYFLRILVRHKKIKNLEIMDLSLFVAKYFP